jgi:predicted DNA-binding transcriptional regulator YafY
VTERGFGGELLVKAEDRNRLASNQTIRRVASSSRTHRCPVAVVFYREVTRKTREHDMAKRTPSPNDKQQLPSRRVKRDPSDAARRSKQAERLGRLLRLLELLNDLRCYNLEELAGKLGCSCKTVSRYIDSLRAAGYDCKRDKQRRCYELRSDIRFRLPITRLSEEELMGQVVAGLISSAPGLETASGARRTTEKLAAQLNLELAAGQATVQILTDAERVISVANLSLADHRGCQEVMRVAQRALLSRRQVVGTYHSPHKAKPIKLRLHPYRLCLVKQAWYLIARPVDEEQPKTYRIARFKSLQIVDEPASVPDNFDLRDYFGNAWAVYRGERTYDVEIEFNADAAPLVLETIWHATQQVKKKYNDGRLVLAFRVDGLDEIVHWVLGWSGRAKVIRPVELREMVVEQLQKALKLNSMQQAPGTRPAGDMP